MRFSVVNLYIFIHSFRVEYICYKCKDSLQNTANHIAMPVVGSLIQTPTIFCIFFLLLKRNSWCLLRFVFAPSPIHFLLCNWNSSSKSFFCQYSNSSLYHRLFLLFKIFFKYCVIIFCILMYCFMLGRLPIDWLNIGSTFHKSLSQVRLYFLHSMSDAFG